MLLLLIKDLCIYIYIMKGPNEKHRMIMLCVFDFQYEEQTPSDLHLLNNKRSKSAINDALTETYSLIN